VGPPIAAIVHPVSGAEPIRGELQREVMRILWRIGDGSVEDVRGSLPRGRRGAYTTVQTVLNRLVERGLAVRRRNGRAYRYSARISEADHVSGSLREALEGASEEARRSALASLAEQLPPEDLEALRVASSRIRKRRSS